MAKDQNLGRGLKAQRAAEVVTLLSAIHRELERLEEQGSPIAMLEELIGELRDALWHEVPRDLANLMDIEDCLDPNRGTRPRT